MDTMTQDKIRCGFIQTDGGREDAGFKGTTGDCVTRSIAIATGKPYKEVYDALHQAAKKYADEKRDRVAKSILKSGASPRNGVHREIYQAYLESLGWKWVSTMQIGSGCKVHLKASELPKGRLIVRVTKHITCVVDGDIHDTYDCSRGGTRCVYGYFIKEEQSSKPKEVFLGFGKGRGKTVTGDEIAAHMKSKMDGKFIWTDEKALAFGKIVSAGSYGDYSGCKTMQSKLERFKELNP